MACVNKQNPDCPNCNKSGLAILPVRYAVVPKSVDAQLPAGLGNKVTNIKLEHYKYALRTLRQGFLYLYYERHSRGSHIKWETYGASRAGTLWKKISTSSHMSVSDEPVCSRTGHNIPASFITIENPAQCGRVWMAFSEHAWSAETLKQFENDTALRDRRMQVFEPKKWIQASNYRHGIEASADLLDQVIEYKTEFSLSSLGKGAVEEISKPDGSYQRSHVERQSTRYPIYVRRNDKQKVVDAMKLAGETAKGQSNRPIVIAMWDNVGIAHELCGFRNDAAARCEMYGKERALEISAMHDIDGLRKALEDNAARRARRISENEIIKWSNNSSQLRIHEYELKHPADKLGRARQEDLCARLEQDALHRAPANIVARRQLYTGLDEETWKAKMVEIDRQVVQSNRHMGTDGKSTAATRDEKIPEWERRTAASAWLNYESHINVQALSEFRRNHAAFYSETDVIIDSRTEDLLKWLESKNILDALTEFHVDDLADGVSFENTVADMIFGISSSRQGALKIDAWISEKVVNESNLIWRAFALNHREMTTELNAVLEGVVTERDVPLTETSLAAAGATLKHIAKISDFSKKALTLHNTLRKEGVMRVPTGGMEKLFLTIGNRFFDAKYMRAGTELLSELFIKGILFAKAGCDSALIATLLAAEALDGAEARRRALQMFSTAQTLMVSKRHKEFKEAWDKLAKTSDIPKTNPDPKLSGSFNEAKELRFGIVVFLLQGLFAWKLAVAAKNEPQNERLAAELLMVRLSFSAATVDLVATCIKALHEAKDKALGFQGIKILGGLFGAHAGLIAGGLDFDNASESFENSRYTLATIYGLKGFSNSVSGILFASANFSYSAPTVKALASRYPTSMIGRASTAIFEGLSWYRGFLMTTGMGFGLLAFVLQVGIWYFADDELQVWCTKSAFGWNRAKRFANEVSQSSALNLALKEVHL